GLHLVPDLGLDESFVRAVVADAPVDDVALVVGVLQHPVHARQPEGARRPFRGGNAAQPFLYELLPDLREAVVSGGVCLECPLHERGTFGVDLDASDLASELVTMQGVAIPDRG